ncbi:hypothetical protein [Paraburkholderia azotifigens]|uniref:Transposase n=1 Tax=Paraburkholderia azotifigens TaxID=2057004 RepID=A0A5C6VAC0_9BURK|nr:hypothetical protein [Paraburkholderia azotifigens]TXC82343.1 hypothetical protein FRZ40_17805 [Paraburkholderia azotifigens]
MQVDQAKQPRHDRPVREVVKCSRWLLLCDPNNLEPAQSVHLKELLVASQPMLCEGDYSARKREASMEVPDFSRSRQR